MTSPRYIRGVPCSMKISTYSLLSSKVSRCRKSPCSCGSIKVRACQDLQG
jgi:hypothetical protein